jgi:hypothetical protein
VRSVKAVVDLLAAAVDGAALRAADPQTEGARDLAVDVGGDRQLAGAIVGVGRELVQPFDAVERDADHRGAGGGELVGPGRKLMRLDVASRV